MAPAIASPLPIAPTLHPNVPFTLRSYQERIASTAVTANTLVVLPTGAGKTLIAATVIERICGAFDATQVRDNPCALFFVPTRLLVKQQATALRRSLPGAHVAELTGGLELPRRFDVLVTTPKAFEMRQHSAIHDPTRTARLDWAIWEVLVFDEVHHVLKEHPYRRLALALRNKSGIKPEDAPRIVGLTASYTYAVGEAEVLKSLRNMCDELRIAKLETAGQEELESSGYHAKAAAPEVHTAPTHAGESVIPAGVMPVEQRKPHLMLGGFFNRMQRGESTPFTDRFVRTLAAMEYNMRAAHPCYNTPVRKDRQMKSWGSHAYSLRSKDSRFEELAMWYEALRLLIVSWEEGEDATATFLRMTGCETGQINGNPTSANRWPEQTAELQRKFWEEVPQTFPRFQRLKDQLLAKDASSDGFRGILFVQQRVTTHILEHMILSDPELAERFSPTCVYAASTPATVTLSVSRSQTEKRLDKFENGEVNLLIATSVAEEGMDIPAANCVIRFDSVLHAVSLIQGRGRARQKDSSLIVLSERADRTVSELQRAEENMLHLVREYKHPVDPGEQMREHLKLCKMQLNRDKDAFPALMVSGRNAASRVNMFAKKTKVDIHMNMHKEGRQWCCDLSYSSILRMVEVRGLGRGRKAAKVAAMENMLVRLQSEFANRLTVNNNTQRHLV